jgi:hypothetical protein
VLGIREIIRLKIVEILSNLEKNPHQAFTEMAIADFLHSTDQSQVLTITEITGFKGSL